MRSYKLVLVLVGVALIVSVGLGIAISHQIRGLDNKSKDINKLQNEPISRTENKKYTTKKTQEYTQSELSDTIKYGGVQAPPNESLITGRVVKYSKLNSLLERAVPEQILYMVVIQVSSAKKTGNKLNYIKNYLDKNKVQIGNVENAVRVFAKRKISKSLFGKNVKARIKFEGDESAGKYWLTSDIKVVKK